MIRARQCIGLSRSQAPKNSGGVNRMRSHDLSEAGGMLYQLGYEATQLGEGQRVGRMCFREMEL